MQLPPLNPPALLQFLITSLLIASSLLFILRTAASRYFAVEDAFERENHGHREFRPLQSMSIGRHGGDDESHSGSASATSSGRCISCGNFGSKVCSRCKNVRYCSQTCQSKHWKEGHKDVCKRKELGSVNALTSEHGTFKVLFPYDEFVRLYNWNKQVFRPCGLTNCGNSCFANVVLQCLACTRPLVAYLLEGTHSRECRRNSWCFLCELQFHIQRVTQNVQPFSPMNILSRLPNISSNLGYGRQEDAHEFMRFVIDTMQSVCLDEHGGEKALAPISQETTLIQHIFGGYLQSQVICTNCNMTSNTYENMMDLTVEIQGDAESLEDCLDQFTVKEWLDGENMYKCDGCNDYVKAWKRLTVHQAPNILTIALKRFQSGRFGKLNKRVTFPETLELSPYISNAGEQSNKYKLFAVVVHLDMLNASFFGHYICYTKDFGGNWYMIDNCKVIKVELEEVLSQGAYMLLYSRINVRQHTPMEVVKENIPPKNPLEVTVSGTPKSICLSNTASEKGTPIKCNGVTNNVETKNMDVDTSALELNKERSTSMDKYAGSKADSMDVATNDSFHEHAVEENVTSNMTNGSLQVHEIPTELKLEGLPPAELDFSSKGDTGNMNVNSNLLEVDRIEQDAPFDISDVKVKGSLYTQETADGMARVSPLSSGFISEASPESKGNLSLSILCQAKRGGFGDSSDRNSESANASSPSQKAKISSSATIVSKKSATSRRGANLPFSRGFLDKPLKKKTLSQVRDQTGEISVPPLKYEASFSDIPELVHAASWEESNSHILPNSVNKHTKTMNLKGDENGQTENGSNCPCTDDRLNAHAEPQSVTQILSQFPFQANGKASSVATDHTVCLDNPDTEDNRTLIEVHGDDSPNESMGCTVDVPQADPKQSLHPDLQVLDYGNSCNEESGKDIQSDPDVILNNPFGL